MPLTTIIFVTKVKATWLCCNDFLIRGVLSTAAQNDTLQISPARDAEWVSATARNARRWRRLCRFCGAEDVPWVNRCNAPVSNLPGQRRKPLAFQGRALRFRPASRQSPPPSCTAARVPSASKPPSAFRPPDAFHAPSFVQGYTRPCPSSRPAVPTPEERR